MSKIYVIQVPTRGGYKLDISKSREFGEIQDSCFDSNVELSCNENVIIEDLNEYFNDITEDDFILQVGEHTLFTTACIVAANYVDKINILKWDRDFKDGKRKGGYYTKITLDLAPDFEDENSC